MFQNRSGELMRAIRDEGAHVGRTYGETKDQKGTTFLSSYARTLTNGGLRFHTDRTDVVGLSVRAPGAEGRRQHARLHARHPQRDPRQASRPARRAVHRLLAQPLRRGRHRQGRDGTSRATAYPLPIFGVRDGKFTSHYSLTFIEAAQLAPDVPKLSAAQKEAIDVLMATAQELCFEMTLEPGDLQLINSHVTYQAARRSRTTPRAATTVCFSGSGSPWPTTGRCRRVTRSCGAASRPASRAAGSSR